jgi:hypothetical protein
MDLKEYCAATHFNVSMIEHEHGNTLCTIEERIEQIEHLLPHSFDAVLTKLDELTLENTALRRAYHKSTTHHTATATPPLLFQQPPGNRQIFERILVQQPQLTFAQHFQTRSTLFCRITR